jgi:hypothetical protein
MVPGLLCPVDMSWWRCFICFGFTQRGKRFNTNHEIFLRRCGSTMWLKFTAHLHKPWLPIYPWTASGFLSATPPPPPKTCIFNIKRREKSTLSHSHQIFCSTASLFTVEVTCTIYSKSSPVRQLLKLHDRCVFSVFCSVRVRALLLTAVSDIERHAPCIYVSWNTWNSERWGAGMRRAIGVVFVRGSLRFSSTTEHAEAFMWHEPWCTNWTRILNETAKMDQEPTLLQREQTV